MVEKKKISYSYKESKKQSNIVNDNLKGDLIVAVYDKDGKTIHKTDLKKEKNCDNYFINPIIKLDVLQNKTISKTSMKKLLKGFKLEFKQLDRKTKTTKPIEISLVDKKNISVKLLNPNKKWKFRVVFSSTNEIRFIDPIPNFNFTGSYEQLEDLIKNYIYQKFDWLPKIPDYELDEDIDLNDIELNIGLKLLEPIQFIDKNNIISNYKFERVNDAEQYYIEKKRKYAELINLFNEKIEPVNNPSEINCVVYYFDELYKKKKRKVYKLICNELKEIESRKKTIYLNDLKYILKKHEITIYIYSMGEYLEFEQYNINYTEKSKCEHIILYIEDNHLYVVKSMKHKNHLTRKSIKNYDNAIIKNVLSVEPLKLLNSLILGFDLDSNTNEIKYLMYDNDKELFTNYDDIKITSKFIKKLGYDKRILFSNPNNFINKIIDKYNINTFSIFPYRINNDVLLYKNNEIIQNEKDETLLNIDKNKCFSNALLDCPFIPIFNVFTNIKRNYEPNELIKDHNLYFIEVHEPNEIYFNNGYRFGYFLNKVGGFKHIKIKYVFECDILKDTQGNNQKLFPSTHQSNDDISLGCNDNNIINPYGVMINDLYGIAETKEEINFIKDSVNKYIGKMMNPEKQKITYKENLKCSNINDLKLMFKNDMDKLYTGELDEIQIDEKLDENLSYDDVLKIMTLRNDIGYIEDTQNKNMVWHWTLKEKNNIYVGQDNKPLHILIRDIAQLYILNMINTLQLKKEDIIEINTDCIYIKNCNDYDLTKINNNPNDFKAWKLIKGYKKEQLQNFTLKLNENEPDETKYFYELNENQYNFNLEYAGGGKTYRIKEQIKNEIKKNNKYSYIILSSFNDFITEYRKDGLNAYTIAHYIYHNKTIKEKNIYVDEFGICSINEILYMFRHQNKKFWIYGDNKQLVPVKSSKVNVNFLKHIAYDYNTKWTNKRNTFSKEFYDELINEKDTQEIKRCLISDAHHKIDDNFLGCMNNVNKIVNTYNTPIFEADKIIAFYNDTVDKYNNLMLKKLNKQFNENTIDIDIPIINTENNLSVKIYNKEETEKIYNRHSFKIISKDEIKNEYVIFDEINKYVVNKETLLKYFKLGYCITLYASQGKTFNSIYYVKDERDIKALLKEGALYTLISRLKFTDKEKYEINVLNRNIFNDNEEVKNIMNFCLKK